MLSPVMLKSDQDGIEIIEMNEIMLIFASLKSDQDGIEIDIHRNFLQVPLCHVKIRPRWD